MHPDPSNPGHSPGSALAGVESHLGATLHALQTDHLPSLLPAAGDNLYRWMHLLQTAPHDEFADLIAELQRLYNALGHGTPSDVAQIRECLYRLAELTTQSAPAAGPQVQPQLEQLGQALQQAAGTL
ncbi:hypothetical protein [Hymenobacter weizhouensis]|uniref:hypothetical protein n=1 Tax=Hymenobacter sp. YIM 151500-1 TaxID=2987689 RepID=UPI0022269118|nr:hypothetical protein [Hymenobacter sp. YIM 151500-1]UYZ63408.1 hypothetical protein OIS53_00850 [Hymenobacter sp. YIM 151500-1]